MKRSKDTPAKDKDGLSALQRKERYAASLAKVKSLTKFLGA